LSQEKQSEILAPYRATAGGIMAEMSSGTALRELQKAQASMKKARGLMKEARESPRIVDAVFGAGWESLSQAYRLMAAIPGEAVNDEVLTRQLAVGRYATALLVRLRRLKRQGAAGDENDDLTDDDKSED
jgi:UDP-N-acetylmuramyl pentapeptide synthase